MHRRAIFERHARGTSRRCGYLQCIVDGLDPQHMARDLRCRFALLRRADPAAQIDQPGLAGAGLGPRR